jgi:moderate conductance mechanosensitive channel
MLNAISRQIGHLLASVILGLALAGVAQAAAPATPAASTPALTSAQVAQALDVLESPQKRDELIATLKAIAQSGAAKAAGSAATQAAPASAKPAAAPAQGAVAPAKPATAPAGAKPAPPAAEKKITLEPNSLGATVLVSVSGFGARLWTQALRSAQSIQSFPLLWGWMVVMATNPLAYALLRAAVWRVALAFACGLALQLLVKRLVDRPIQAMEGRAEPGAPAPGAENGGTAEEEAEAETLRPSRKVAAAALLHRVPSVFARFLLDLLPVIAFALGGHILAATPLGGSDQTRLIVLAMVDGFALALAIIVFTRALVSPHVGQLRLFQVSDATAAWIIRWVTRLAVNSTFGYAIAEVGLLLGMSMPAYDGVLKVTGLINHTMLAIMVLQKRRAVRNWLRAPMGSTGMSARLRNAFAAYWHWYALFLLVAVWFAWAVEIRNGIAKVFHIFVALVVVALISRLLRIVLLGAMEKALTPSAELLDRYPGLEARMRFYHPITAGTIRILIYVFGTILLLEFWGVPLVAWFASSLVGVRVAAGLGTMVLTVILALAVWEAANASMESHLARLSREQQLAKAARMRTLMPLLRTSLFTGVVVVAGLTILSEVGINIAPLLAGAGIIGVAIGFGSQKLVQDLITGMFLLLENAMQVGDSVTVSGLSGTVENLSVRTIRLRAADGSVHIIPFSAVTSVTNTNRGLGNAAVTVTVAFDEDTDRVMEVLKQIASEMRKEPDYASKMLSDIQLWGVDKVDGASATISGQIPCTDTGRWPVQREFNRRVKKRFQDMGIAIFNPSETYVVAKLQGARRALLPAQEEAAE